MNVPKCCDKHPEGLLTPEFIAHLPTCEACQKVLKYLNDDMDRMMAVREKAKLN
jgi:hypothetical protein